ncbi:hypothetical protein BDZ85DRAFT_250052 [Elsinoe ampelina]|uniref:BTB domain-containing protein n=1 Tax=Elsinoe ampelina TaxID=302913 RepID=A0A6A6GBR6_9PEZI|nr:hypothetical protein BDZ85DRAFT_250052 [Elsinoe ampelina]
MTCTLLDVLFYFVCICFLLSPISHHYRLLHHSSMASRKSTQKSEDIRHGKAKLTKREAAQRARQEMMCSYPLPIIGDTIVVEVGPKKRPLNYHKEALVKHSGYLAAHFRFHRADGKVPSVSVSDHDPAVFIIWARYAYTGKLQYCLDEVSKADKEDGGEQTASTEETITTPADTPASNTPSPSSCPESRPATASRPSRQPAAEDKPDITTSTTTDDPEWQLLINLYLLGHFLLDLPFTNKVIDAMIDKWHADQRWPCGYAGLVFRETGEDTPLRRLIVDFHIYMGLGRQTEQETFDTDGDEVLFLKEVNRALAKLKWDRFEHEWYERPEPWEEDGCRYHLHVGEEGEEERRECEKARALG